MTLFLWNLPVCPLSPVDIGLGQYETFFFIICFSPFWIWIRESENLLCPSAIRWNLAINSNRHGCLLYRPTTCLNICQGEKQAPKDISLPCSLEVTASHDGFYIGSHAVNNASFIAAWSLAYRDLKRSERKDNPRREPLVLCQQHFLLLHNLAIVD